QTSKPKRAAVTFQRSLVFSDPCRIIFSTKLDNRCALAIWTRPSNLEASWTQHTIKNGADVMEDLRLGDLTIRIPDFKRNVMGKDERIFGRLGALAIQSGLEGSNPT